MSGRKRSRDQILQSRNITDGIDASQPARKIVRVLPTFCKKPEGTNDPHAALENIARERGMVTISRSYQQVGGLFETVPQDLDAWSLELLAAVRDNNVDQLRALHQEGHNLRCSNTFGETLLHIACRKSLVSIAQFLIEEVGMPANIHDPI